jgi:hypothetical protein
MYLTKVFNVYFITMYKIWGYYESFIQDVLCMSFIVTNELLVSSTFLTDWFPLSHRDSALASYCAGRLAIILTCLNVSNIECSKIFFTLYYKYGYMCVLLLKCSNECKNILVIVYPFI